jgi:hypothetical protein
LYSKEKVLEILEAYDLTKSLRSAAALVGCDSLDYVDGVGKDHQFGHGHLAGVGYRYAPAVGARRLPSSSRTPDA